MKFISLLLIVCCLSFTPKSGLTITDESVILVINKNTTQEDFKAYHTRIWDAKGINFYVYSITRSSKGAIDAISIKVDCNDGFSGTANVRFNSKDKVIGFGRYYKDKEPVAFKIGDMD